MGTEKSDISSVDMIGETPAINKNLMKLGAFEMSPEPIKAREMDETKTEQSVYQSPQTPVIPKFTTVTTLATFQPELVKEDVNTLKRSAVEDVDLLEMSPERCTQSAESRPSTMEKKLKTPTPNRLNLSEDLSTPTLTSPLVSTKLKGMTPRTPLSNRIVDASLDIGTKSKESAILEYEEFIGMSQVPPAFDLSLFPAAFQVIYDAGCM